MARVTVSRNSTTDVDLTIEFCFAEAARALLGETVHLDGPIATAEAWRQLGQAILMAQKMAR